MVAGIVVVTIKIAKLAQIRLQNHVAVSAVATTLVMVFNSNNKNNGMVAGIVGVTIKIAKITSC